MDESPGGGKKEIPKGLPVDWSNVGRGPERFVLNEAGGWGRLLLRYAGMGSMVSPLHEIFKVTVGDEHPTHALLESSYIDEDFRDEYIGFYANTYRDIPRRCERLHFFRDAEQSPEEYLGYVVLRPIIGRPVCRTMLRPPAKRAEYVSCIARYSTTPWGLRKHVDGFPFISQDYQFGSCAHAAIWMIALYFHLRFRRPRYHLSDLARSARNHHDFHPHVPTRGLTPRQVSAVLQDLGMAPVIYQLDERLPDTFEAIACRYLNSGLPVMLLTAGSEERHAKVLIGYGRDAEGLFFVHHDDQRGPYLKERGVLEAEISQFLVVPMPGKIFLSGEAAVKWVELIIEFLIDPRDDGDDDIGEIDRNPHLPPLAGGLDDGRLRLCAYVTEVGDYKRRLRDRKMPEDVVRWHTGVSTSHWIWIVELQSCEHARKGPRCVLGEIVIDATSDDEWVNPLFGNLPGLTMHWPSLGDDMQTAPSDQQADEPYDTGCALHVAG